MNFTRKDKQILIRCFRRLCLLMLAFLIGSLAGRTEQMIRTHAVSAPVLSASENWGLSFQEKGKLPVTNASIKELKAYDAYYAQDTTEKRLYLTFDCGYENGATPTLLDALKKHQCACHVFCRRKLCPGQSGSDSSHDGRRTYRSKSYAHPPRHVKHCFFRLFSERTLWCRISL